VSAGAGYRMVTAGSGIPVPAMDVLGVPGALDVLAIRKRLGRADWGPPIVRADGARYVRSDDRRTVIVSASTYPDDPDRTVWVHASIAVHGPGDVYGPHATDLPTWDDLTLLHRAVWPGGYAFQVFAPPSDHVDITQVLHLWGRLDGQRIHPDFAWRGAI
jgi:hypothetical protein